jgi:F-type H+-transporting ATPase subunit delta
VAKRYAKALFGLAYSQSKGDASFFRVLEILKDLSDTIQSNPSLKNILFNPSFGIEEKKRVLKGIVDGEAKEVSLILADYLKMFLSILVKKSRLVFLPEIVEEIERLKAGLSKTTPVLLTVPVTLSEEEKTTFTQKFEKILQQKILLTVKVSPEVLGGMTIQIGSKVFDASLQMKLSHLRHTLMGQ